MLSFHIDCWDIGTLKAGGQCVHCVLTALLPRYTEASPYKQHPFTGELFVKEQLYCWDGRYQVEGRCLAPCMQLPPLPKYGSLPAGCEVPAARARAHRSSSVGTAALHL